MPDVYETGMLTASGLPAGQRTYYEQLLLDTLRVKSILVPFCAVKEDFKGRDTGRITYTEVLDTEPNWNAKTESNIWSAGAHLDSRSISIDLEIHGDVIKISEYNELVNFWNNGDLTGLVNGKLGQNMIDHLDILARNAFLAHPTPSYGGDATSRASLVSTDVFDIGYNEVARVHLEEAEVPGVATPVDGGSAEIVCVTTPRVLKDIRTASGSKWIEAQNYAGAAKRFTSEVGMYGGVRFIKTNRNVLKNFGTAVAQSTLDGATVPGQGAAATVDVVYSVGQSTSTRYITLAAVTNFVVGQSITVHNQALGTAVLEGDGTAETRRIVNIDIGNKRIALDRPLMKPHASGDYVTNALDIHASIYMGGPAIVYAVGERPHPFPLPVIDDLGMVRRFAWRGFMKFQLFRPEFYQLKLTAASAD